MNVHSHLAGRKIRMMVATSKRRYATDFPGWGQAERDGLERYLLPIEVGMEGVITDVESHGMYPYTRVGIRFEDGTTAHGVDPQVVGIYDK